MKKTAESSLASGVAFMQAVQRTDGGFDSFSSPTKQPFVAWQSYDAVFAPALILNALSEIPAAAGVCNPLATWLLAQKSPAWSFNYWAADAGERTRLPYPDDLDDTFCALIGLKRCGSGAVDASALGSAVRLLLATERAVGGPYRTWLVSEDAPAVWRDVDLAVNSNIAYFLRLVAQPLPNLTKLMETAITSGVFHSQYYPTAYPVLYYIARAYRGELAGKLFADIMRRRKSGHWGTPLQTALALSALGELGKTAGLERAVAYLVHAQLPDGSWPAEAFCLDPAQDGRQYFSGAPALTTALVLEALQHFAPRDQQTATTAPPSAIQDSGELYAEVVATARKQFSALDGRLRDQALLTLKRMVQGDHSREIVLLPYFFAQSLRDTPPPKQLATRLGLANLYGWAAYTIYDDFLDASGDARLLSVANVSLRYSLEQFRTAVPRSAEYQQFVRDTFDTIDGANAWEVMHCRFGVFDQQVAVSVLPGYGALQRLAARSLGHALTPLGILAAMGIPPSDPAARWLLSALKHYLIARQLHDDLHDWEPDIRAGQCSYVVARILADLRITPGTYPLAELVPRMQYEFWHHTLPAVGQLLLRHAALARRDIVRSNLLTASNSVTQLLDNLEESVQRTLNSQADAETFLRTYRAHNATGAK